MKLGKRWIAGAGPEKSDADDGRRGNVCCRGRRARGVGVQLSSSGRDVDVILSNSAAVVHVETGRSCRQPCDPVQPGHPATFWSFWSDFELRTDNRVTIARVIKPQHRRTGQASLMLSPLRPLTAASSLEP